MLSLLSSSSTVSVTTQPSQASYARSKWVCSFCLLVLGAHAVVKPYVSPSGSMEQTLLPGDYVLVDRVSTTGPAAELLTAGESVRRGDVILFRYPPDPAQVYIKRVIGIPGDRVRIVEKQVYLNGTPVDEPYAVHRDAASDSYRDFFPALPPASVTREGRAMLASHVENAEIVVPPGMYFTLGDNRDYSLDSRYWGFVPREAVIGKPLLIYWSVAPSGEGSAGRFDPQAELSAGSLARTRWERILRIVGRYPLGLE